MTPPEDRRRAGRVDRQAYAQLLDLAGHATVGLRAAPGSPDGRLWGSGVLIAPGWVLTCAHVFVSEDGRRRGAGPDGEVGVVVEGRTVPARLEYDLSRPAPPPQAAADAPEVTVVAAAGAARDVGGAEVRPDLALVRLLHPCPAHACAWFGDQPATLLEDAYIFRGYDERAAQGRGAEPVDPFIAVRFSSRDSRGLHFGSDVRVTPGASGGPLLDCDRGEVVGIVKSRHREDRVVLAVPFAALRALGPQHLLPGAEGLGPDPYHALLSAHDRWHWEQQQLGQGGEDTWFDVQRSIMAGRERGWELRERLQALSLLAELPAPRDPYAVEAAVGEVLGLGGRAGAFSLRTWRDGHGALYQASDAYAELCNFVHYLRIAAQYAADEARAEAALAGEPERPDPEHAVARGPLAFTGAGAGAEREKAAARLAEFVTSRAVVLGAKDRERIGAVRRRPDSLLVEFEPLFYDAEGRPLFNWRVSEGYGQGHWLCVDLHESDGGLPFEQAEAQVLRRLGARLRHTDDQAGARVRLEVAVPEGFWHTPAAAWPVAASTRRAARLRAVGTMRTVILRDQGRRHEVDAYWLERWQNLTAAQELRPLRIPPRERAGAAGIWAVLERGSEGAVPVLCRTVADGVGREVVGRALDVGYPVGLWHSGGHGDEDCNEVCEVFHRRVRELLAGPGGVTRLPELVRNLRGRAEEGDVAWARELVLLYDDPGNPIPQLFGRHAHLSPR